MAITLGKMRKRAVILFIILIALLALLVFRVAYWQIVRGEEMKARASEQQTNSTVVVASRGTVYDRNNKPIAESASVDTVVCNPQQIAKDKAAETVATKLSAILSMDYESIYKLLTKTNRYQVIKKRITVEETQAIKDLKDSSKDKEMAKLFSGIYFEQDSKRYYKYSIAPHIIGFTGYDNNGLQGIEMTFDDELTGRAGSVLSAKSANGTDMDLQYEEQQDAQKGANVVLTIDETIQHFLEKRLETAVAENQLKEGAAGIIMNPKTGDILAMATKPDFDVNNPYSITQFVEHAIGLDEDEVMKNYESEDDELQSKAIAAIRNKMWRNKAITDTYEPGSTFKIMTAAMALEENVVDDTSTFSCPGFRIVADRKIRCSNTRGHGAQNFEQAVQNSCNPAFMELGKRVGPEKFAEYFKAFGLTEKTGIEMIGESNSIYYKNKLSEVDLATSSFGQGFSVTPIQLITAISSVINGGNLMKPHIVKEIRNESGIVKSYQPEIVNKVISEETSRKMREVLESVVASPTGSGKNAYIKGYRIGGKTGTSEKGRNNNKRIASFVGFAPADDPQIVCLIMMDEPQVAVRYGGTIAAPVVGAVMEETLEYLGVERQYTEEEAAAVSISVPELRQMSVDTAKKSIQETGFKVKVVGDGEVVVDQLPKPGVSVTENSTVIIYTEEIDEEKYATVPDVTGKSVAEARRMLEDYGLNFEAVGAGQNSASGAYAVKQSKEPGEKVPPATVISVEFRHAAAD